MSEKSQWIDGKKFRPEQGMWVASRYYRKGKEYLVVKGRVDTANGYCNLETFRSCWQRDTFDEWRPLSDAEIADVKERGLWNYVYVPPTVISVDEARILLKSKEMSA